MGPRNHKAVSDPFSATTQLITILADLKSDCSPGLSLRARRSGASFGYESKD